jgi:hypothetical protein
MRGDASRDAIRQAAKGMKAGAVNQAIVYLTFRFMLLRRAYTRADFERMIEQTGFRKVEILETLIGLEILLGK